MKKIVLSILLTLCIQLSFAQSQTIKGHIADAADQPVIGATVQVDGSKLGAVTDLDGNFTILNVPAGSSLTISYIGMKTQKVKASPLMSIQMKDDSKMLDEVVTIGYGTQKAKDLTSPHCSHQRG
jgi:hypothetical protein